MMRHEDKLRRATVVAGFDDQDLADEALLELRSAGVPDQRIGYYCHDRGGRMVDLLSNHHRFAAAVVWGLIGGAVGVGIVYGLYLLHAAGPDPVGLAATLGVCGALFLGTLGGVGGVGPDNEAPLSLDDPYILTVETAGSADRVWEIIHRRGGHELRPHTIPAVIPARLPM
jgi:hypothetical protein